MEDLLKDAIADAKAVRETAIENAKLALEEAFTPTIQSMLSKKLQAEMSEDDEEMEDEEDVEDEEEAPEEGHYSEEEEEAEEAPAEDEEEMDDEVDESEVIEINGVKYIPLVSEEDDEEEEMGDEEEDEDEELDLEAIIRELEAELDEAKDEDEDEEVDEAKETDEVDEAKDTEEVDESKSKEEEVDESDDVDLEEVIKAIEEEEKEEEKVNELETVKSELDEYREAVKVLRGQLSEVNMLNAKLLFTNKLFRAFGLSEAQKVKVIETFDRAKNIREVKLVYSTLAESFGSTATPVNESFKKKGSASKVQASTKSAKADKVITEGTEMRDRFKKLANIL